MINKINKYINNLNYYINENFNNYLNNTQFIFMIKGEIKYKNEFKFEINLFNKKYQKCIGILIFYSNNFEITFCESPINIYEWLDEYLFIYYYNFVASYFDTKTYYDDKNIDDIIISFMNKPFICDYINSLPDFDRIKYDYLINANKFDLI